MQSSFDLDEGDKGEYGFRPVPKYPKFLPKFSPSIGLWILNVPPNLSTTGKRSRQYFRDRKDALRAAHRIRERHRLFGASLANLSPVRMSEASEAYRLLDAQNRPYSLLSIVRESIERTRQQEASVSLLELTKAYVDSISHRSVIHRQQIMQVCARFPQLQDRLVSDITERDLSKVLDSLSAGTRNRFIRTLSILWHYAIRKQYAKENIIAKLDRTPMPKKPVETFSNEVIEGMLNLALQSEPELVPYFALGAFAGLRTRSPELLRLLWSDIHFDEKEIAVRAEIAKTGQRRFVQISPNLEAWLQAYLAKRPDRRNKRVMSLTIGPMQEARTRVFRQVAGPKAEYIPAGLRHTFASNHLALHNDINSLVLQLGHQGSLQTLWNHYHLHTRKDDAIAFWNIFPPVRKAV